jgi:NLR family CARD domain-containing protein 3
VHFVSAVEYGLMSLSSEKQVACQYSGIDKKRGIVFEISVGRIDVGASISFLSQYPNEREYLMQPLCCLEVL